MTYYFNRYLAFTESRAVIFSSVPTRTYLKDL